MKKIIKIILLSFLIFINFQITFASSETFCTEEIIKNSYYPVFSPDGKSISYQKEVDWKKIIVKDWIELNNYDEAYQPIYSLDSNHFAYMAEKDGKNFIIKDWIEIESDYDIGFIRLFSPDFKHLAYKVEQNWKSFVVKDWIVWKSYDDVYGFLFSPNWESFSYIATENWESFIVKDWVEIPGSYNAFYSADSNDFYYLLHTDLWYNILVKNWVELDNYKNIYNPIFSPDGNTLFYHKIDDAIERYFIEKNWYRTEIYSDWVFNFIFSPDSKSFIYAVLKWDYISYLKDWVEIYGMYNSASSDDIDFSTDSKNFAYITTKEMETYVVKDWITISKNNHYNAIKPVLIDENTLYYTAEENWKNFIVKLTCDFEKQFETLKNALSINNKYKKYLPVIDEIVKKTDKEKLEKILFKINKLDSKNSILKYLQLSIYLKK